MHISSLDFNCICLHNRFFRQNCLKWHAHTILLRSKRPQSGRDSPIRLKLHKNRKRTLLYMTSKFQQNLLSRSWFIVGAVIQKEREKWCLDAPKSVVSTCPFRHSRTAHPIWTKFGINVPQSPPKTPLNFQTNRTVP